MPLSLQQTAIAIAQAMLAGPPEFQPVHTRVAAILNQRPNWLPGLVHEAIHEFGPQWIDVVPAMLAEFIIRAPGFNLAWHSSSRPSVIRPLLHPPEQRFAPPQLGKVALPQLNTLGDLADWLELTQSELNWFAYGWRVPARSANFAFHHYGYRTVSKHDGRHRLIESPKSRLCVVQKKILHEMLNRIEPHNAVHGFRKGHSIVSYAAPHVGKRVVIRVDLANFFASVPASRVHAVFRTLGYPLGVARALTAICTNRVPSGFFLEPAEQGKLTWRERQQYQVRHLPQGAPSSPALANLCAYRLDLRLGALAQSMKASYTRYADDIAFSGDEPIERAASRLTLRIAAIALEEGFIVQMRKTRVMRSSTRQHLANVVVNQHPNIARDQFDILKAILTNCLRRGPVSQNIQAHPDFRLWLAGKIAHVKMLNATRGDKLRALYDRIVWDDKEQKETGHNQH